MDVDESRSKFFEAKTRIEDCRRAIAGLQNKHDTLEASLPELTQQIENAERMKKTALETYALHGDKQSESELRKARTAYEQAVKQRAETNELVEAIARTLKKQEQELVRLNNLCELSKRECWESIAGEIRSRIPDTVISDIQNFVVSSMLCCKTKQFVLSELLPNLNPSEYRIKCDELVEKYGIAD